MAKEMFVEVLLIIDDDADPQEVYTNMDLNVEHKNIKEVEVTTWGEYGE